jgi:hypothetical protein
MMVSSPRVAASLLLLAFHPLVALASAGMVERFDVAVANLPAAGTSRPEEQVRPRRSSADVVVERRLNIEVDFPYGMHGAMFGGLLRGEPAVFTRSGGRLDATVMRNGGIEVMSFEPAQGARGADFSASATGVRSRRVRRSVPAGHFEDPAAYSLQFDIVKHDDLVHRNAWDLHARYVAWWAANLSIRVLPVEPMHINYVEQVPGLTNMPYGRADSLEAFERALKHMGKGYGFDVESTYKKKFVLLTAGLPMPGTTGVAFQGGNEAIASVGGRDRILAHEIGHMLGATHENAQALGWLGCETNMLAHTSRLRSDCFRYSSANERAIRSYMRHGPDTHAPRHLADAPANE